MKLIEINNIEVLPKKEGVYFLWGENELLYIGKSKCIQRRIKSHLYEIHKCKQLVNPKEIKRVSFILCHNHEDTKFCEESLINIIPTKNNGCENWYMHKNILPFGKLSKEEKNILIKDIENVDL